MNKSTKKTRKSATPTNSIKPLAQAAMMGGLASGIGNLLGGIFSGQRDEIEITIVSAGVRQDTTLSLRGLKINVKQQPPKPAESK